MQIPLKIYVARLSDERTEKIEETLPPAMMQIDEKDLQFKDAIHIQGKAYIAEDHLVIQLKIETKASLPCAICNEEVKENVSLQKFYHTEELEKIRGDVYDYSQPLREAILLEIPSYVECMGNCPTRAQLKNYLKKGNDQFPFADLS